MNDRMFQLEEPLILSVSGRDRPGVLATLAGVLATIDAELVDIEQATLQDFLALSFLVDLKGNPESAHRILQHFFPAAAKLGLTVEARSLSTDELRELKATSLWALTILASRSTAAVVAAVAEVTSRHHANIVSIRRLAQADIRAAEFIVDTSRVSDLSALRRDLVLRAGEAGIDVSLARESVYRQSKRAVVLDADSTLISGEIIDEVARLAGVVEEVSAITARAMAGELDFAQSLTDRVALLEGVEVSRLLDVAKAVPLTPGAREMVSILKRLGFKVGVISGGFTFFTNYLKELLGLDYAYGNTLEVREGRLTGRVVPPILDAQGKADKVREIARLEGLPLSQIVGVGDGANDIPMLQTVGLGVAFCAKEVTRLAADGAIHQNDLAGLLYLLGVSQRDLAELLRSEAQ